MNGYAYVLVSVDVFSRYAELVPLRATKDGGAPNSSMTAQAFMNSVVQHWGPPAHLISDGGPEFKLHFEAMCHSLQVDHHLGTPHHSAGHGMVEKLNRTVTETLAKLVNDEDSLWETMIPWAQLAYNAAPHSSLTDSMGTAVSPAEVHTGTRLNITPTIRGARPDMDAEIGEARKTALASAEAILGSTILPLAPFAYC